MTASVIWCTDLVWLQICQKFQKKINPHKVKGDGFGLFLEITKIQSLFIMSVCLGFKLTYIGFPSSLAAILIF